MRTTTKPVHSSIPRLCHKCKFPIQQHSLYFYKCSYVSLCILCGKKELNNNMFNLEKLILNYKKTIAEIDTYLNQNPKISSELMVHTLRGENENN